MENRIVIPNRGMLEIKDSYIKCFLGKDNNCKSSEQLWNELKVGRPKAFKKSFKLGEEEYLIYYPIPEKKISVIAKDGKEYKSTIYFIDDIKNINEIKKVIKSHNNYKRDKSKRVSSLGSKINSKYYSFNQLYNFCIQNNIQIYYYDLKEYKFYIKNDDDFTPSELDLSNKNQMILDYTYDIGSLKTQLRVNMNNCDEINKHYKMFLKNKRKKPFSYEIDKFNFSIIIDFANKYFKNVTIFHYIDLRKVHLNMKYQNLANNQAIICLKINHRNLYEVDSFIYKDHLIVCKGEYLEVKPKAVLDKDNDFLVAINFDSITDSLKLLLKDN